MAQFRESRGRSVTKALTYRVLIITADGLVILLLTHRYDIALTVVIVSNIYSTLFYIIHERIWDQIKWGKLRSAK